MESDLIHIHNWLRPLSWLYGLGVELRNLLFDNGLLRQKEFQLPVICIGNISVGGTGKTPHTEYLLRMLLPKYRTAVLSRGYKRRSKGYQLATADTPVEVIGDEPWQMKQKFPEAIVAVDANRCRGIEHLISDEATSGVEVILLDDAFQHRYVRAGLNIVLTDYHRLATDDALLPAGRLREPVSGLVRAQIIIVTKCPTDMAPIDYRVIRSSLQLKPYQRLFFSTIRYGDLRPLFDSSSAAQTTITPDTHVLLLTGIASPQQMYKDLQQYTRHITPLSFPDHHAYSKSDMARIETAFAAMQGSKRVIVTTEKDGARLLAAGGFTPIVRRHIFVLPIVAEILQGREPQLHKEIIEFISNCR